MTFTGFSLQHLHDPAHLTLARDFTEFTINAILAGIEEFTINAVLIAEPKIFEFKINAVLDTIHDLPEQSDLHLQDVASEALNIPPAEQFKINALIKSIGGESPSFIPVEFTVNAILVQLEMIFEFFVNALIKQTPESPSFVPKDFTINALITTDQMIMFTVNGIVKSIGGESGSFIPADFSINAQLIKDGVLRPFTISAVLRATVQPKVNAILIIRKITEFEIDAFLTGSPKETFFVNALLEEQEKTKTFTIQGILFATVPETFLVDSLIANDFPTNGGPTITKFFLSDALIQQIGIEKEFTINAIIKMKLEFSINALLVEENKTKTFTIDALIANNFPTNGGTEITKFYLIDSCIRGEKTLEFTIDAITEQEGTIVFLIDAILSGAVLKPFTIDAILNDLAPVPFDFTIDAQIGTAIVCTLACVELPPAPPVEQFLIDAFLTDRMTFDFTIDAKIVRILPFTINARVVRAVQATVDALIASPNTKLFLIDAVLKKTQTKPDVRIDALLQEQGKILEFIVDAQITEEANTKVFTIDAVLKGLGLTEEFTIDARIAQLKTKLFTIDAVLFKTLKEFSIDAILEKGVITKNFSIDAIVGDVIQTICDFETVIFTELDVESEFL